MPDLIQNVAPLMELFGRCYQPNEALFLEGDPGNEVFIINKGRIQISTRYSVDDTGSENENQSKTHDLWVLMEGDILGEIALLNDSPRSATATALEETEVVVFTKEEFYANIERYPQLAVRFLKLLTNRLLKLDAKLKNTLRYNDYLQYRLESLPPDTQLNL